MTFKRLFVLGTLAVLNLPGLADAGEPPNVAGVTARRAAHTTPAARRHPRGVNTCSGGGANSFVGVQDGNLVGGVDSSVLSGSSNTVCVAWSAVATGQSNTISTVGSGFALNAFIGGGYQNILTGSYSMIGAGDGNTVSGTTSMIGSGQSNQLSGTNNFIGGGSMNQIAADNTAEATITGGAGNLISTSYSSFIGGGSNNVIKAQNSVNSTSSGGSYGVIGGGYGNSIAGAADEDAVYTTIGGGYANSINAVYGTIAGGANSTVNGIAGTVAGGEGNTASGYLATVPGGYKNVASGTTSFAAGFGALAEANGTFVWSDYSPGAPHVGATVPNQFLARASGGVSFFSNSALTSGVRLAPGSGTWSSLSDRKMKTAIESIDGATILAKVERLPVTEWSYTSERGVRHIGPMAQDFYSAFRVGEDDRHITTIDEDGVALAAVKAVHAENVTIVAQNAKLHAETQALRERNAALEARVSLLERAFARAFRPPSR